MAHGIDTRQLPNRKNLVNTMVEQLNAVNANNPMLGVPKIIYASRTHSQISQGNIFYSNKRITGLYDNHIIIYSYARIKKN